MLNNLIPASRWLSEYNRTMAVSDLIAGLTTAVVLIPQAMAYALIAGLPPVYGLYAALVPLLVYGVLGTSAKLAVGPVAVVALLVAAGTSELAEPGTDAYITMVLFLALITGVVQLLMGLLRMGFMVHFMSHPVITGFVAAAAILIAMSQVSNLTGVSVSGSGLYHQLTGLPTVLHQLHAETFVLGITALVALVLLKRWNRNIPGALVVVAIATIYVAWSGGADRGVAVVGSISAGWPVPTLPVWPGEHFGALLQIGIAIALIGYMESMAVARSVQPKDRKDELKANQELNALGAANIAGSLFQAFPVTGGFSRTAINSEAGAKTGMAGIITATLVALALLFFTPLLYYVPYGVLAALIIVAVSGLIDVKEMGFLWKVRKEDFAMMMATLAITLFVGVKEGLLAGVLASFGAVIYHSSKPHVARLGKLPGTRIFKNADRFPEAEVLSDTVIIRFDAPLFFANAAHFGEVLEESLHAHTGSVKRVVVDASGINSMDTTGLQAVRERMDMLRSRGISLLMAGAHGPVRDLLEQSSLFSAGELRLLLALDVAESVETTNEETA